MSKVLDELNSSFFEERGLWFYCKIMDKLKRMIKPKQPCENVTKVRQMM